MPGIQDNSLPAKVCTPQNGKQDVVQVFNTRTLGTCNMLTTDDSLVIFSQPDSHVDYLPILNETFERS